MSATDWRLRVTGLVEHPQTLSPAALQATQRASVKYTLECAGNHGLPFLIGASATRSGPARPAPHRHGVDVRIG